MAVQAEVEGVAALDLQMKGIAPRICLRQRHIVRQVDVGLAFIIVGDVAAVPGCPGRSGAVVGRVVANVLVRSAANGVAMLRRFGPHAGRAQQGTQAQRYTYDPFLPRHFVTRSSSRFISLRYTEGCGVYTPMVCGCGGWADRVVRPYGGCKGVRPLLTGRGEFPYNGIILRSPVNEARALGGKKYGG